MNSVLMGAALEPVSEEEWFQVASSFTEWEEKRLANLSAQKK
jgi:hypothetical protein